MRKFVLILLSLLACFGILFGFQGEFTDLIELKILEKRFENELIKVDLRIPWLKIAKDVEFSKSFNGEIEERFTLLVNRVLEDAKWVQNDPILSSSLALQLVVQNDRDASVRRALELRHLCFSLHGWSTRAFERFQLHGRSR